VVFTMVDVPPDLGTGSSTLVAVASVIASGPKTVTIQ
jgi:hypothetical protein